MLSSFCQLGQKSCLHCLDGEWGALSFPPDMASSDPGELRPPSLPISTTQVQHKFSFFCARLFYMNHMMMWPSELNGVGAQATSISPRRCWWESSLHGEQVKTLDQKSKSSRREAVRARGRSERVQVIAGNELHLEVAIQVLLFCRCSHLSLKPLLLSAYTLNTAKSQQILPESAVLGRQEALGNSIQI